ncbi:hypothetical protein Mal52_07250 [Symmachiella dynata]|uniref:Uncharacterized protein n=1 Tax=Symmachiella dynata TaxID=2527995 RepID=A0A517ZIJ5_9PLAN|nr:hypothetical protein [Symmachiella dynata]QDU42269.1 hypothetical protein Mal52_07250 [Symmachiella dynata]
MSNVRQLHDEAMLLAEQAYIADLHGYYDAAQKLFTEAYESEAKAADLVALDHSAEPSRSILLRSAASLAIDCHKFREAEKLVSIALSGNPPEEIAEELRDLLEKVYFSRHLSLRGMELDPTEFQLTLTGAAISRGLVESRQFLRRAEITTKLLCRTAERMKGIEFRETGRPNPTQLDGFETYLSVPRAASFAITVRMGRPNRQMLLPGFLSPNVVVDDFLSCITLFNDDEVDNLNEHIDHDAYYQNFVSLTKKLAPDGTKITNVGFTSFRGDEQTETSLTKPATAKWSRISSDSTTVTTFIGRLTMADEMTHKSHRIGIEVNDKEKHTLIVPPGMLDDIVKPLWGEIVTITAEPTSTGSTLKLLDIEAFEEAEGQSAT